MGGFWFKTATFGSDGGFGARLPSSGFAPKLQATTRRGDLFRTELPPLVSDPDFWCKAGLEEKLATAEKRKAVNDLLGDALKEGQSLNQGRKYMQGISDAATAQERYQKEV